MILKDNAMIKNPTILLLGRAWGDRRVNATRLLFLAPFWEPLTVASGGEASNLSKAEKARSAVYLFKHSRTVVPIFLEQQIVTSP